MLTHISRLPLLSQFAIIQQQEIFVQRLEGFLKKFFKINEGTSNEEQKINPTLFFIANMPSILEAIQLMGDDAITYFESKLGGSVLPLERELATFPWINSSFIEPMHDFFVRHKTETVVQNVKLFTTCLTALSTLTALHRDETKITSLLNQSDSFDALLNQLNHLVIALLLKEMAVDLNQEAIEVILKRNPPDKLAILASASNHMDQDQYRTVFLNFLKLDLMQGDVDRFLHDKKQDNPVGKALAHHNSRIRSVLTKQGIDPERALNYKKHFNFIVKKEEGDASVHNLYLVLASYLKQFLEIASKKETIDLLKGSTDNTSRLNALLIAMNKIEEAIKKNSYQPDLNAAIVDVFSKKETMPLFDKITKNGAALKKAELGESFYEFYDHMDQQLNLIKQTIGHQAQSTKKVSIKPYHFFSVEQWDKGRAETFFLGDNVGCCLATSGAQFQAMVQRRMDDAMLFHVAVDQTTNTPIALIWLYLAETQSHDIVLMANFFEVASKFGNDVGVRKAILNGLLTFTQGYLADLCNGQKTHETSPPL